MLDEARLRGIDLKKLRRESFTSRQHIDMVRMHEIKAALYWSSRHQPDAPKRRKTSEGVYRLQEVDIEFTETQINIAKAIFRNEK